MKKKILFIIVASFLILETNAQETVSATGGNYSGTTGTVSFTVGQVAYSTNSGSNGKVLEGVQQPFEIFVTSTNESIDGSIELCVSPNPITDFLKLKIQNLKVTNLNYELYDLSGKLLIKAKITNDETSIDMKTFVTSSYLLKVMENYKEIKTFKILKNK